MNNKKKTYQQPKLRIVGIRTSHFLSGSGPNATWLSNPSISGSRSSRTWDDDDEDY